MSHTSLRLGNALDQIAADSKPSQVLWRWNLPILLIGPGMTHWSPAWKEQEADMHETSSSTGLYQLYGPAGTNIDTDVSPTWIAEGWKNV